QGLDLVPLAIKAEWQAARLSTRGIEDFRSEVTIHCEWVAEKKLQRLCPAGHRSLARKIMNAQPRETYCNDRSFSSPRPSLRYVPVRTDRPDDRGSGNGSHPRRGRRPGRLFRPGKQGRSDADRRGRKTHAGTLAPCQ